MLPENIDIVSERQSHDEALLRVNEMTKVDRMAEKAVKRFRDFCFGRTVDKELRHLIGKVVAGRSMNRPAFSQRFGPGENLFQHHVDGAAEPWRDSQNLARNAFALFSKYSLGR